MTMKLFDSAFSPFARKVRMVLEHKGLAFEAVDGLVKQRRAELRAANGRLEVPTLVERRKIFWRGDRIEWLLARGFHDWFFNEIRQQRVLWPGPALPAPLRAAARG